MVEPAKLLRTHLLQHRTIPLDVLYSQEGDHQPRETVCSPPLGTTLLESTYAIQEIFNYHCNEYEMHRWYRTIAIVGRVQNETLFLRHIEHCS